MNKTPPYEIAKITHETHDTFTWTVTPKDTGEVFTYKPGQFAMIHLYNEDRSDFGKKPYSFSSSPHHTTSLEFGIKVHGDFTQKMATLKEGDTVGIEGPYGVFIYHPEKYKKSVLFAGGIGVTPFISMIRFATAKNPENHITLFYNNRTEKDIAYKAALDELGEQNKNLTIVYSVDKQTTSEWDHETGFIDEVKIRKHVADFTVPYFLMCGPMPFMRTVEEILLKNNVAHENIKREVF